MSDNIKIKINGESEIECEVLGTFISNSREYMALVPADGTDDIFIYRYEPLPNGDYKLNDIEDGFEFSNAMVECENFMSEIAAESEEYTGKYYNVLEEFTQDEITKLFTLVGPVVFQDLIDEDVYKELKEILKANS
ncbi:MAG: DUF1292 domain-containing protein [Bacilli bacterium]